MKKLFGAFLALFASVAMATTTVPVQLLNPAGSTAGQAVVSTGPSSAPGWGSVSATALAAQAANTVVGNFTGASAAPTAFSMPSCSATGNALGYTSGTGFTCFTGYAPLASPTFTGTVTAANVTATGTLTGFKGRLINVQTFTATATYTPTTGTAAVIVDCTSGGGAGGGSAVTSTGQISLGAGGQAGGRAMSYLTSGFNGVTVTIGAGGTGVSGAAGNSGGTTSFGALISIPGGSGGNFAPAVSTATIAIPLAPAAAPTGGNIFNTRGALGQMGVAVSATIGVGGGGASGPYGSGGQTAVGSAGFAAAGLGAGGGGAEQGASAAATAGGNGTGGVCIVDELSQ
ncbi:hypothetical protein [Paraburkholderia unamae]|uniref:Uncharacterized protein n=1 Tax=Paraburkholderia unamae TaxID=219649 RepID=A0ACC6RW22_9BURK